MLEAQLLRLIERPTYRKPSGILQKRRKEKCETKGLLCNINALDETWTRTNRSKSIMNHHQNSKEMLDTSET
jgi:hypothetical protein